MIHVVTGTDTDVGKTRAVARLAADHLRAGRSVHIDKPIQTGVDEELRTDVMTVTELLGNPASLTCSEGLRLGPAMSPIDAAAVTGTELPDAAWHRERLEHLATTCDVLIVEGAGGSTVELTDGHDMVDLAVALSRNSSRVRLDVVTRCTLGTQNHTLLTLRDAKLRGAPLGSLIVSRVPRSPDPVVQRNLSHLERLAGSLSMGWGPLIEEGWPDRA